MTTIVVSFAYFFLVVAGTSSSPGGGYYGSLYEPSHPGSRGGLCTSSTTPGGRGGGRIHITIGSEFLLDGQVLVNGEAVTCSGGGGGSGGSVWIEVGMYTNILHT